MDFNFELIRNLLYIYFFFTINALLTVHLLFDSSIKEYVNPLINIVLERYFGDLIDLHSQLFLNSTQTG
jgi:hypothetical protein